MGLFQRPPVWAAQSNWFGPQVAFSVLVGLTGSGLVLDEGGRALSKEAEPEAGHSFDPL